MALTAGYISALTTGLDDNRTITQADVVGITPAAGDKLLVIAGSRPGATALTPTALGAVQVGTSGGGRLSIYEFDIVASTFSVSFATSTGNLVDLCAIVARPGAGEEISYAWTSGNDTSSDTSFDVTGAAPIALATGDVLMALVLGLVNSSFSSPVLDANNATLGTQTTMGGTGGSLGGGYRFLPLRKTVSSNSSATSTPTFNATTGSSSTGGALFLGIRSAAPAVSNSGGGFLLFS
jgi:hypothetical protein